MGAILMPGATLGILQRKNISFVPSLCLVHHHSHIFSPTRTRKRRQLNNGNRNWKSRTIVFSSVDDSNDSSADMVDDGDGFMSRGAEDLMVEENELVATKKALSEARARQEAIEKERDQLLEELARSQAKQQEHVSTILHDKEVAIAELEAAKSLFHNKLQESVEEKFTLESQTDAQRRVLAAETSAAEAAFHIEEQVRNATEGTILSIVEQSKDAIEKALDVAEKAGDYATRAVAVFNDGINPIDEIAFIQSENIKLQGIVNDLESQLLITRNEIDKLKVELEQVHAQAKASDLRAEDAKKALLEFQESNREMTIQQEEKINSLLEKMKKDAAEKKEGCIQGI
ncbi:ALPHA-AMYLASE [Salix koriyanagi]|uniref:ALPHA-AMYLASE n=1 Tax=Salix koriyanagi TaxID=2511006 RepID=A0A9Q0ZZU6_9ROSI|nr:ALPHA-AMYLASE [Salix koriyanagi]